MRGSIEGQLVKLEAKSFEDSKEKGRLISYLEVAILQDDEVIKATTSEKALAESGSPTISDLQVGATIRAECEFFARRSRGGEGLYVAAKIHSLRVVGQSATMVAAPVTKAAKAQ